MTNLAIFLSLISPQEGALDRLSAFLKNADKLSVKFTVTSPQFQGVGKGSIVWRRPREQAYAVTWGQGSASYRQNPKEEIEINRVARLYVTYPGPLRLATPPGTASALTITSYPAVLVQGGLREAMGPGTVFKLKSSAGGVDTVIAHLDGPVSYDLEVDIDAKGRPSRIRNVAKSAEGTRDLTWTFSDWDLSPKLEPSMFAASVPDGYVPYTLPVQATPPEVRSKAPDCEPVRWGKGKWLLLAFVNDERPSTELVAAWPRFRRIVTARKGVDAFIAGGAGRPRGSSRVFVDTGRLADAWRVPGWPFLVLVDPTGKIAWLGFGYRRESEKQILDSLAHAK